MCFQYYHIYPTQRHIAATNIVFMILALLCVCVFSISSYLSKMEKQHLTRAIIHIVSRNSNWQARNIENTFVETGVYADKSAWTRFAHFFLLGLGAAFTLTGIVFFFAYNWADMHKFFKLGLIQALIAACISAVLFLKMPENAKKVLLAAASVLVGALFAVFGQIYQTGANAYDFFLGWTVFIALWAIVSNYAVLWLILLVLINTTILLYIGQVARTSDFSTAVNTLIGVNLTALTLIEWLYHQKMVQPRVQWLTNLIALAAIGMVTMNVLEIILDKGTNFSRTNFISLALALMTFGGGLWYGLRTRNIFYMTAIPFSMIILMAALVIRPFDNPIGILLVVSLFIVVSTILLIRQIIHLNKQWNHDNL
jgi:uncharacterized membrane protein